MIERPEGGERAILVRLHLRDLKQTADIQEFQELALSAGANIIDTLTASREAPDPKFFIGSGKVEEIRQLVETKKADIVLFDHSLSPAQERNLERNLKCRVLDRTGLILDIFAQRARTYEGRLQVELAQLKHHSTRLIRGWTHLERQKGGIGLRGPGETQLEVDRRLIRARIKYITARLEKVRTQRDQGRRSRKKASLPTVSMVGYTNAGKSTLFNVLTGAHVFVANQLFATLDPTLRVAELPTIGKVIIADTVGFVSKLPHDLVEAFRATLEEVQDADLLIHVIDSTDDFRKSRITEVESVLEQIGALEVPRIEVYNKIDLSFGIEPHIERDESGNIQRVFISSVKALGLDLLKTALMEHLRGEMITGQLRLGNKDARLRALLYDVGAITQESLDKEGEWVVQVQIPAIKWKQLCAEFKDLEIKLEGVG